MQGKRAYRIMKFLPLDSNFTGLSVLVASMSSKRVNKYLFKGNIQKVSAFFFFFLDFWVTNNYFSKSIHYLLKMFVYMSTQFSQLQKPNSLIVIYHK